MQDRARRLTDPAVLAEVGDGGQFPLYYVPLAENGNFLESNEIAKRHGVCGDPRLVRRKMSRDGGRGGGGQVALAFCQRGLSLLFAVLERIGHTGRLGLVRDDCGDCEELSIRPPSVACCVRGRFVDHACWSRGWTRATWRRGGCLRHVGQVGSSWRSTEISIACCVPVVLFCCRIVPPCFSSGLRR